MPLVWQSRCTIKRTFKPFFCCTRPFAPLYRLPGKRKQPKALTGMLPRRQAGHFPLWYKLPAGGPLLYNFLFCPVPFVALLMSLFLLSQPLLPFHPSLAFLLFSCLFSPFLLFYPPLLLLCFSGLFRFPGFSILFTPFCFQPLCSLRLLLRFGCRFAPVAVSPNLHLPCCCFALFLFCIKIPCKGLLFPFLMRQVGQIPRCQPTLAANFPLFKGWAFFT